MFIRGVIKRLKGQWPSRKARTAASCMYVLEHCCQSIPTRPRGPSSVQWMVVAWCQQLRAADQRKIGCAHGARLHKSVPAWERTRSTCTACAVSGTRTVTQAAQPAPSPSSKTGPQGPAPAGRMGGIMRASLARAVVPEPVMLWSGAACCSRRCMGRIGSQQRVDQGLYAVNVPVRLRRDVGALHNAAIPACSIRHGHTC